MKPLIYKINYDTPFRAFFYHALTTAIIIGVGFAINDYIDYKLKEKNIKKKIGKKIGIHFLQAFLTTFIIIGLLYVLFGLGTSNFPICSYIKHCDLKRLK